MATVPDALPPASPLEQLQAAVARQQSLIEIQDLHMALQDEEIAQQGRDIRELISRLAFMLRRADAVPEPEQAAVNSSPPAALGRRLSVVR